MNLCTMQTGDFLNDGEPQSTAVRRVAEEPVEALEYALALVLRNAWAVVANRQAGAGRGDHAYRDAAVVAAVADRVIDQIVAKLL